MKTPIKRALDRFERAVRMHAMIGSQHPDEHDYILYEYAHAKKLLINLIEKETAHESA